MYGDFYSTVTLSGAYKKSVQSAVQSNLRKKQASQNIRSGNENPEVQTSWFFRLRQRLATRLHRQVFESRVQTPAE